MNNICQEVIPSVGLRTGYHGLQLKGAPNLLLLLLLYVGHICLVFISLSFDNGREQVQSSHTGV